jgi:hypothetical protein
MKTIEIKRATEDGLVSTSGVLLEWEGFQFCLTDVDNQSMAIELSCGASAYNADVSKPIINMIKSTLDLLESKGIQPLIEAMDRFKKEHPEFKYPINKQIK